MATAKGRALPDFLIIGTQKGGTGSLFYLLTRHPQIHGPFSPPGGKELYYFSNESNYKKGELWYRSHFPLRFTVKPGELVGEKTPEYLCEPDAAERIQKDLPNAKLICLLRNPSKRAVSHYFMRLRKGIEQLPIMEAMLAEKAGPRSYKKRGLYLEQLKRYESYLKKNQMLILSSEEFFANPQRILKQVFKFLGFDENFQCSDPSPRNVGKNKVPVPSEVHEYLNEYFKLPNKRLYRYLNRDFGW
jgi:hypothetical protein